MGIKYSEEKKYYIVTYSRRHPVTKESRGLRRQGIKSRKEAERVYRDLIYKLALKFNESCYPFWKDLVVDYVESMKNRGLSNNTIINYESSLRIHTFEKWIGRRVNEITTLDIRDVLLVDLKDYSESHKKSMLKFLKGAFLFAVDQNYIERNPVPTIKFKSNKKIKKVLNQNEVGVFLKEARRVNHSWFYIWATACFTGMRNGELFALRWEHVDLQQGLIFVRSSWTRVSGYKSTKSGDDRVVEVATELSRLLMELKKKSNSDYVLPRVREWETGCQAKVLKDFLKKTNLPEIRFHDLRASWATIMLSKGKEPIKVMSMGGWSDLSTMQIYIRKSGIDIRGLTYDLSFLD